jgi:GNAT superfamily N-acetyltransferase
MTIRFATHADIPAAVALGAHMHSLTRFARLPYQPERVAAALAHVVAHAAPTAPPGAPHKYVFLLACSGTQQQQPTQLVGGLIAVLEQHIFSQLVTASVMHYDVLPQARMGGHGVRLLKALEQWCINRGVAEINLGINSGGEFERVGRFMQRVGYTPTGGNFVKVLGAVVGEPAGVRKHHRLTA